MTSSNSRRTPGSSAARQPARTPRSQFTGDRYGDDILSVDPHRHGNHARRPESQTVTAERGLLIEDVQSGFVGEIVRVIRVAGAWQFELEDANRTRRSFPMGRGYWIEGRPVELVAPAVGTPEYSLGSGAKQPPPTSHTVAGRAVTASGSLHVAHKARVARESRIWVEGKHDAELVAKVWGEDLALEGVVVEELLGVDHLVDVLAHFRPDDNRRAGILVDHLVAGSKESRIAREVAHMPGVLVLGHPYVDVWQAVKPSALGMRAWPHVPRGEDIKVGTLARIGWPHADAHDIGLGWARILSHVNSYRDLEPSLLGRMEELIDFVTEPGTR
ncbi:DUF3097 family protein [Actinomycetaceae bacterium L2_0104]